MSNGPKPNDGGTDTGTGAYPYAVSLSPIPAARIQKIFDTLAADTAYEGWDARLLRNSCKLVSASFPTTHETPATAVFALTIEPYMCNVGGNLHGGCASTILDNLTSTVLHLGAREGFLDHGSVSRTLTVTFLRPVPLGMQCTVEAELVSAGRTLAHVRGVIRDAAGKACVSCVHDKAVVQAPKL